MGIVANQRGLIKGRDGERPRFGGIIYAESAEKVAYFIERCDRQGLPILFVVTGVFLAFHHECSRLSRENTLEPKASAMLLLPASG